MHQSSLMFQIIRNHKLHGKSLLAPRYQNNQVPKTPRNQPDEQALGIRNLVIKTVSNTCFYWKMVQIKHDVGFRFSTSRCWKTQVSCNHSEAAFSVFTQLCLNRSLLFRPLSCKIHFPKNTLVTTYPWTGLTAWTQILAAFDHLMHVTNTNVESKEYALFHMQSCNTSWCWKTGSKAYLRGGRCILGTA